MSKLDSTIKDVVRLSQEEADVFDAMTQRLRPLTAAEDAAAAKPSIPVLVKYAGDVARLEEAGLRVRTVAGNVIAGDVAVEAVDKLAAVEGVERVEAARPMWRELNVSRGEVGADAVHAGPPANLGAGCLVGVIDSGVDYTHGSFRTAGGQSRIRYLWDQTLAPVAGEASPAGFGFGVEYTQAQINAALAAANPFGVVRHRDTDGAVGHGTHVSGIAAGDGSDADAGNGIPANTVIGMAPGAELIVVTNSVTTEAMGDSASTLDAARYIFEKAAALGRPVVINMSQGDNIGPHDGTSLLEEGLDNLLGGAGRCMVKSAGNEGAAGRHAMGTVSAGVGETVRFVVDPGDTSREIIDIWYPAADRFSFGITPPGGAPSAAVNPGTTTTLNLPGGNSVFVDSVVGAPSGNGDNRIFVTITRGTAGSLQAGTWSFTLTGVTLASGSFHAWIERGNLASTSEFTGTHRTNSHTISIPGTAKEVITAGSYINTGAGAGNLSGFSSRGPTRDGRQAPTLCAPGENVTAPRAPNILSGSGLYHQISGTSMAAPHIAGVAALMLTRRPGMTQAQVRDCLQSSARADAFTGPAPNNNDWGRGKLDAQAAVACAGGATANKFIDDVGTPIAADLTLKRVDDGAGTAVKFADDIGTPIAADLTLKRADDGGPVTINKFRDDGGPVTINKFVDDGGGGGGGLTPNKRIDDVKASPGRDKNPAVDPIGGVPGGPVVNPQPVQPAPFVLATPHHSTSWGQSYPEAHAQLLARYEDNLRQLGEALTAYGRLVSGGNADPETLAQLEQVSADYRQALAEYQHLAAQQGR